MDKERLPIRNGWRLHDNQLAWGCRLGQVCRVHWVLCLVSYVFYHFSLFFLPLLFLLYFFWCSLTSISMGWLTVLSLIQCTVVLCISGYAALQGRCEDQKRENGGLGDDHFRVACCCVYNRSDHQGETILSCGPMALELTTLITVDARTAGWHSTGLWSLWCSPVVIWQAQDRFPGFQFPISNFLVFLP